VVTGDDRQIRKLGDFDYAIADWLTEELWIQSRPKAGARVVTRSLDLDKLRITTERTELTGTETTVVDGVVMTVFNVKTEIPEDRITITGTVDQNGQLLSMQMPGFVELRREPENLAKDITFSADLFWHSVVRVDKPLGDPQKVVALEVELLGGKDWGISSGPCQAVDRDPSGNKITLRLGRKYGKPVRATEEEIRENLAESVLYPIAHPRVKETAQKATANAKTPREKVEQLIAFVGELVEDDYFAEPLTVLDILNRKRGDCSEHALLFTTLARSVGIPAREVSGLVSMGEESNALGGHQWCEVVLEGSWVPVDPTFEELDINATHISFGAHAGEQIQLMSKLKGTSLKVLKVVTAEGNP
jgi:hypothetical protein